MQVSLKWLGEYCSTDGMNWQEVGDILTELGLEVEGTEHIAAVPEKVLVAEIVECGKHPGADKLNLCQVITEKEGAPIQVVCGAPNVRKGLKVAFATLGAVLPGNFKIKKTKIRGVESIGMICSERELQISDEHDGILELDDSFELGRDVSEYIDTSDTIFDLSITPNRSDCLGVIGVARDLAARLKKTCKIPEIKWPDTSGLLSGPKVELRTASASARFCVVKVEGIKAVSSPSWLQNRVIAAGMRPINAIVDATNFVMMEQGHPVHAYDAAKMNDQGFIIRDAVEGDVLRTLDGNERRLSRHDLVVCNGTELVGSPVMGGESTQVGEHTTSIICEAAHFDPIVVRQMSKRMGLRSEASHRFERGVDEYACERVCKRLASVIVEVMHEVGISSAKIASQLNDCYRKPKPLPKIALRIERTKKILSIPYLKKSDCIEILQSLGCVKLDETDDRVLFEIPSYRLDLTREIDLIEEVGRVYGLDKIDYIAPQTKYTGEKESRHISFMDQLRIAASTAGLCEAIFIPFTSLEEYKSLGIAKDSSLAPSIELLNPIQAQAPWMPSLLLPGLIKALKGNRSKGQFGAWLFETGKAYSNRSLLKKRGGQDDQVNKFVDSDAFFGLPGSPVDVMRREVIERRKLGIVLDGIGNQKSWNTRPDQKLDFYSIKSKVLEVLISTGVDQLQWKPAAEAKYPFLHPKASAEVCLDGVVVGFAGELHPNALLNSGLTQYPPVVAEIDLDLIWQVKAVGHVEVDPALRQFPPLVRDFAFEVGREVSYDQFVAAVDGFKKKRNLRSFELFDQYTGDRVAQGQKSLAWRFVFESQQKTLTDSEVDKESKHLIAHLENSLQAKQR